MAPTCISVRVLFLFTTIESLRSTRAEILLRGELWSGHPQLECIEACCLGFHEGSMTTK